MKRFKVIGLVLGMALLFTGCKNIDRSKDQEGEKVQVVTSFYAMKSLVEEIGGDKVDVVNIIDEGIEPHDFEPKAKDLMAIEKGDLFIYNGANMEEWIDDVKDVISSDNVTMVNSSEGVKLISAIEDDHEDEIEEEDAHNHDHEEDPHTWLGISTAMMQGKNIKDALVLKDPDNSKYYEENYNEFEKKLNSLLDEYTPLFNSLENKDFVTGHATFAYLCRDLNLHQESIEGVYAEGEPSAKQLEELIEKCKANKIKVIFVEKLVSPALSETLAREVGGETKLIYTLHSNEDNKSFSEVMEYNVKTIYDTLRGI